MALTTGKAMAHKANGDKKKKEEKGIFHSVICISIIASHFLFILNFLVVFWEKNSYPNEYFCLYKSIEACMNSYQNFLMNLFLFGDWEKKGKITYLSYPDDLLLVVAGGVLLWLCCGCFCFGAVGLSYLCVCLVSALSPGQVVPLGCSFLLVCAFFCLCLACLAIWIKRLFKKRPMI